MKKILLLLIVLLFAVAASWDNLINAVGGDYRPSSSPYTLQLSTAAVELVDQAYQPYLSTTIGPNLHDFHLHLLGASPQEPDTWVNPRLKSWLHPLDHIRFQVYLSAAGINSLATSNSDYMQRLELLAAAIPAPTKYHLMAFDHNYDPETGLKNLEESEFYISNRYAKKMVEAKPDSYELTISLHPSRPDWRQQLDHWAERGAKIIKWLPNAQHIDPDNSDYDDFYRAVASKRMIILSHVGEEKAVHAEAAQAFGNPLKFRRPLDFGVRVIMAHAGSLGENDDLDNPGQQASNFSLFLRMMDDPAYDGLLFGEISALTQVNRLPDPLITLLDRKDLHQRLVNGSDYPLPAVNIVIQLSALTEAELLSKPDADLLAEIYHYNPLMFDFVLKRSVRSPGSGNAFADSVFGLAQGLEDLAATGIGQPTDKFAP